MKPIIIIALIGSIILNILLFLDVTCTVDWINGTCQTTVKVDSIVFRQDTSFCVSDTGRFHNNKGNVSGVIYSASEARAQIDAAFESGLPAQTIRGGFISKLGLNAIFNADPTATGINVYIGKDDSKYYLISEAGHNNNYIISRRPNMLTTDGPPIIQSGLVCPMDCGDMYNQ